MLPATVIYSLLTILGQATPAKGPAQEARRVLPGPAGGAIRLHNGWMLTPAGRTIARTSDMVVGCAQSPDRSTIAMTAAGAGAHTVYLLDAVTGRLKQSIPVSRAWNGLAWSPDGSTLYVSGGVANQVVRLVRQADGSFELGEPIVLPALPQGGAASRAPWMAGLALSLDGETLYIALCATDEVLAVRTSSGEVTARRLLNSGARPYALVLSPDGRSLYVTQWAAASLAVLDAETLSLRRTFDSGRHPNALLLHGDRLFVTCGNEDVVAIHQAESGQIREWVSTRLTPRAPAGSTPSALALSPDGTQLWVALADNNLVALVDVSRPGQSRVLGFVPTAWYPTSVALSPDGKRVYVGSGKGLGTGPNPPRSYPIDPVAPTSFPYIATLLHGTITAFDIPGPEALARHTRQALANSPYSDAHLVAPRNAPKRGTSPIPSRVGDPSPIRHVLYIIKENRTYDQVLGSLKDERGRPLGKGDPRLTLFGEDVAPNHHALALEFVTLDNFYADGEVSVDGHHWSNAAYVPDFMARTWPQQYSGRGTPPLNTALSDTPSGRIWDVCERHGVIYRTYYYHTRKRMSAAWAEARDAGRRDYDYVDIFLREFDAFEKSGTMPQFMIMALSEDHTRGTRPGAFTPKACVASNDLALGKIVERISRSPYWKKFAIFVLEDDAQNGPDHVDAHRTVALAISPYSRKRGVDSTFYTTASMLRTIELILGLPPMSQFDAGATPMYAAFHNRPDLTPYRCRVPRTDLQAKNGANAFGARRSMEFDFSAPDLLTVEDEDALNRILWHSIKGAQTPYPGIRRTALLRQTGRPIQKFDEDD